MSSARWSPFGDSSLSPCWRSTRTTSFLTDAERRWFIDEVRRGYPFAPFVGGRIVNAFEWNDLLLPERWSVFLDIYGANHDPRYWKDPHRFRSSRFADRKTTPFDFVSRGGGDARTGHRCPGEDLTVRAPMDFVSFFVSAVR